MRTMKGIVLTAAEKQARKLLVGSWIIMITSMIGLITCLVGICTDREHVEAYCFAFAFCSITSAFGLLSYDSHKNK
jgi:hypothetical protein